MENFLMGFASGVITMVLAGWIAYLVLPKDPDPIDRKADKTDDSRKVYFAEPISFEEKFKTAEKIDDVLEK